MVLDPRLAAGGDVVAVVGIEEPAAVSERGNGGAGGVPIASAAAEPGRQFADPLHPEIRDGFMVAVVRRAFDSLCLVVGEDAVADLFGVAALVDSGGGYRQMSEVVPIGAGKFSGGEAMEKHGEGFWREQLLL